MLFPDRVPIGLRSRERTFEKLQLSKVRWSKLRIRIRNHVVAQYISSKTLNVDSLTTECHVGLLALHAFLAGLKIITTDADIQIAANR